MRTMIINPKLLLCMCSIIFLANSEKENKLNPATESVCYLNLLYASLVCFDNYTPDPSDDTYSFLISLPISIIPGAGIATTSIDPTYNWGGCYCWDTWESPPYPITGAPTYVTVTIVDEADPNCTISWTFWVPESCNISQCSSAGFDNSITVCENAGSFDLLPYLGNPLNIGTWIPGLASGTNIFNPSLDPTGTYSYVLSVPGCPLDTAVIDVEVESAQNIILTGYPEALCSISPTVGLPVLQDGISGTWSGPGVNNNTFNPEGLSGSIQLTFTPAPNECADISYAVIEVEPATPIVIENIPGSVCQTDIPLMLHDIQSGIAGNWSGPGVSNNTFSPFGLNGNIQLTFIPDAGECAESVQIYIFVNPFVEPIITGIPVFICELWAPIALAPIQNGISGNWSGQGVVQNIFNPEGLTGPIFLTFTPEAGQCADVGDFTIQVETSSFISVTGVPDSLCGSDVSLALPDIIDGILGDWSGPGVFNNFFYPEGQHGDIQIFFTPESGECSFPADHFIFIEDAIIPVISDLPDSICQSEVAVTLATNQNGIPGNWSGSGISNNTFHPAGLSGDIVVTFTPTASNCIEHVQEIIFVHPLVSPIFPGIPDSICPGSASLLLPASLNAIEGNWIGEGVLENIFFPSGLTGNINLQFVPDTNFCSSTVSTSITVMEAPSFTNLSVQCDGISSTYVVSFDITGGMPGTLTVNGAPVLSPSYTSQPFDQSNASYQFIINDQSGCGPVEVTGMQNCGCATNAGTMDFTLAPLSICTNSSINVDHYGDHVLDPDDILIFVLHDNSGTALGNVLATSSSSVFSIPSGITLGQTYFVSAIAGTNDGTGNILLTDDCLSVAPGIPVQFYLPTVSLSQTGTVCYNDCFTFQVQFEGEAPFELTYNVIKENMIFPMSLISDASTKELVICPSDFGTHDEILSLALLDLKDLNCNTVLTHETITMQIIPEITSTVNTLLCEDEALIINGTIYDKGHPDGTETFPSGSFTGCDSTVFINLSFQPNAEFHIHETLCYGSNVIINGTLYDATNPSGIEIVSNGSLYGCDSVINIQLSFDSVITEFLNDTLCSYESLEVQGIVYDKLNPGGSALFEGGSVFGCDSVVLINLTFRPEPYAILLDTLCTGESLFVNGTIYNELHPQGTEIFINGSFDGCDSTLQVKLTYVSPSSFFIDDTLQSGESITILGTTYDQLHPEGVEVIPNGNVNGCDSMIFINLHYHTQSLIPVVTAMSPLCYGQTGSILIEKIDGGFDFFIVSLDSVNFIEINSLPYLITGLSAGMYKLWIRDKDGLADPVVSTMIITEPNPLVVNAGPDLFLMNGEDVLLQTVTSSPVTSWVWTPADFLDCVTCPNPSVINPDYNVNYVVEVKDANGCTATDAVAIRVKNGEDIFVPNVFSPNKDGINDLLMIYSQADIISIRSFRIYSRWGDFILEYNNFLPNDPLYGWDGTVRDQPLNNGVFIWVAEIDFNMSGVKIFSGEVTLLK